jgi:hypothetical protein
MADYGMQPNPLNAFKGGYDAAQAIRDQAVAKRAGNALAGGDTSGATNMFLRAGDLTGAGNALTLGARSDAYGRAKDVGAAFNDNPAKAAAIAATGGDVQSAMAIQDHIAKVDDHTRATYKEANHELASMMVWLRQVPPQEREARRQQLVASLPGMFPNGNAPEVQAVIQRAKTIPLDDASLTAEMSKVIGMDKLLGHYTQRQEGNDVVTYHEDPFGPPQAVDRHTTAPTRADARGDAALALSRDRNAREARNQSGPTPSKVMGPIFEKLAQGQTLSPGERQALNYYKMDPLTAGAIGSGDFGGGDASPDGGEEYGRAAPMGDPHGSIGSAPLPSRANGGVALGPTRDTGASANRPGRGPSPPAAARAAGGRGATVPPAASRRPGQVYDTPRGPMKWTGTGWLPQ